jgi:hypothetical protein
MATEEVILGGVVYTKSSTKLKLEDKVTDDFYWPVVYYDGYLDKIG